VFFGIYEGREEKKKPTSAKSPAFTHGRIVWSLRKV